MLVPSCSHPAHPSPSSFSSAMLPQVKARQNKSNSCVTLRTILTFGFVPHDSTLYHLPNCPIYKNYLTPKTRSSLTEEYTSKREKTRISCRHTASPLLMAQVNCITVNHLPIYKHSPRSQHTVLSTSRSVMNAPPDRTRPTLAQVSV